MPMSWANDWLANPNLLCRKCHIFYCLTFIYTPSKATPIPKHPNVSYFVVDFNTTNFLKKWALKP